MLLVFGPNSTYFFEDGAGNRKYRASPEFTQYLAANAIGTITAAALGEGGAYFLNYTTADGFNHMNAWHDPEDRYEALHAWLFTENLPHDRKSVCVTLGSDGAFFAASDQGHRWRRIPEELCDYYQKFTRLDLFIKSRINTADLGVNGTFLGIGVDNTWFWSLKDEYPELSKMLGQRGVTGCQFIAINPFGANQHVVVFHDKTVHWSVPPLWLQDFQSLIQQYATNAGAYLPPALPPRPPLKPNVNSTSSGRWRPSWRPGSGSSSPAVPPPTVAPPPLAKPVAMAPDGSSFDWNQAMGLTQSALDAYNSAQGAGQGQGGNVFGNAVNGVQMVNDLANNGLMIGQLVGQVGSAAAACCVM